MVDGPGRVDPGASLHHPDLHGPADNRRHHQPQGAQTAGRDIASPARPPGAEGLNRSPSLSAQKGCGYHLDLLWVGVMLAVCSIMGLPWFVAATVLSITHVNSLKLESESSAPGEQPRFLGIREQRLTGLLIFLLMGCSVFMTGALQVGPILCRHCPLVAAVVDALLSSFQFIPMPVLYGVFLYMGVSSLKGIQVNHHGNARGSHLESSTPDGVADVNILPAGFVLSSSTV